MKLMAEIVGEHPLYVDVRTEEEKETMKSALLEQGINVPEWRDGLKRYVEEAKTIEE